MLYSINVLFYDILCNARDNACNVYNIIRYIWASGRLCKWLKFVRMRNKSFRIYDSVMT